MHSETLKFVNAQQAKPYNIYRNTKLMKLLKTNTVIWFNKICRDCQLQPKTTCFAATTPGMIFRILNSVFFK